MAELGSDEVRVIKVADSQLDPSTPRPPVREAPTEPIKQQRLRVGCLESHSVGHWPKPKQPLPALQFAKRMKCVVLFWTTAATFGPTSASKEYQDLLPLLMLIYSRVGGVAVDDLHIRCRREGEREGRSRAGAWRKA
jgi:hypothetical protein